MNAESVVQLFEAQVDRTPDLEAATHDGQSLSYRELNLRANQLAHLLRSRGVGPEVVVGLYFGRSLDMLIGVLGVLKAGSAYLPLDPAYPPERLALMLRDARVPWLLTQETLLDRLPEHEADLLCLDMEWQTISGQSRENPSLAASPDNLAYVIYTSGSTGRPKGVAMVHRRLLNLIDWQRQVSKVGVGGKTLQFASLSFAVSFKEIFATWCAGGTLVLISEERRRDPGALLQLLVDASIERVWLPFVALQQLAEFAIEQSIVPAGLRELIIGGDRLRITPEIVQFLNTMHECRLRNEYGVTESHVATSYSFEDTPEAWPVLPPVGRPIANTQIYLLDGNLSSVPVGFVGELYVGGNSLARGYLHHPRLTAESFIPHPFSPDPGARLYGTGDLARYLPDGNIEFLGRADYQVKIRGFLIEPGEIEAVLSEHPDLREVLVLVKEKTQDDKRLVAYIVPDRDRAPVPSELGRFHAHLRGFLREKLPEYMVPSAFVLLTALPLTPNGKIDRRALPEPDWSKNELDQPYDAPRTPLEEVLTSVWAEVMDAEQVGIHDSFFEMGGNSLLATQVVSRIRKVFRLDIPLRAIFEAPTVAEMSKAILAGETSPRQVEKIAELLIRVKVMPAAERRRLLQE